MKLVLFFFELHAYRFQFLYELVIMYKIYALENALPMSKHFFFTLLPAFGNVLLSVKIPKVILN